MNLANSVSLVPKTIKSYIEEEMKDGGLLSDVETLIPSLNNDVPVDPPAVWIVQHPTTQWANDKRNLSSKMALSVPFEFVCVEYSDDLEEAEMLGIDLASRVGSSLMKNLNKVKVDDSMPDRFFHAPSGGNGRGQKMHGINGADCIIKVPIGTLVFDSIFIFVFPEPRSDWLVIRFNK